MLLLSKGLVLDSYLVSNPLAAHLRFQVIGRNFWGGYQEPVLPFELQLSASVEEERHVGVLLSFC